MFVLDTFVTMSWCFEDEASQYGDRILEKLEDTEAIVPSLWRLEVANVLLMAERKDRIKPARSKRFVELLHSLPIEVDIAQTKSYMAEISASGRRHKLTAYDTAYLELAARRNIPLASLDDKLKKAAKNEGVKII